MKLGPLHVVRTRTMDTMRDQLRTLERRLEQALADLAHANGGASLHSTTNARLAPFFALPPDTDDERSRAAVARVIAAYQQAREDYVAPTPCLWDHLTQRNRDFIEALNLGDEARVGEHLRALFQTPLVWGLGLTFDAPTLDERAVQVVCADQLRALAEAVGAARLTSHEQNFAEYRQALDVDLDALYRATERVLGRSLACPEVGGAFGCELAGARTTPDQIYHAYTVARLQGLGLEPGHTVAEIGGGYGCLAYQCVRAGVGDYTIYDLPWVNALQGYYLLMALPEGTVRLYGETGGTVAVLPSWCFDGLAERSVDWVVNTNSLPEMGHATATAYLRQIAHVVRRRFLSINQEARAAVLHYGPQQCVAELVAEVGGLRRLERARYWMRNGYVEEVYAAARPGADYPVPDGPSTHRQREDHAPDSR